MLDSLPTVVAAEAVQAGELWPMLDPDILPTYHVYLISRDAALSLPARALLDMIGTHLKPAETENEFMNGEP